MYNLDYQPDHISEINSLETLRDAILATLKHWRAIHDDPEAWAAQYTEDETEYYFQQTPIIENDYFSFDWASETLKRWIDDNTNTYCKCSRCGSIFELDWFDCDCDDDIDPEEDTEDVDSAELAEYFRDIDYIPSDIVNYAEDVLVEVGYPIYRQALSSLIDSVIEEVSDVINQIENATTNAEELAALTWALHLCHVNGQILNDYGNVTGLDYELVNEIQQNGLDTWLATL